MLAEYVKQGKKAVAMEVSSHGLDQGRVDCVAFDYTIFTNLTREHLDYHGTMTAYAAAKEKLFQVASIKSSIFNIEDDFGYAFMDQYKQSSDALSVSIDPNVLADVSVKKYQRLHPGFQLEIATPKGLLLIKTRLVGLFNVSNMLGVLAVLLQMGYPLNDIGLALERLTPAPGRMQSYGGDTAPLVVVDYAHSPDALEKALGTARKTTQSALWCVVGCGGDRDKGKRPAMARIAESLADHVIFTDDNPRFEDSKNIIDDMLAGVDAPEKIVIEPNRKKAIAYAIAQAKKGDVVLVAGKGHETYQIYGDKKTECDDRAIVQSYLKNILTT